MAIPESPRELCLICRKAKVTCYCARLRKFESDPLFVILTHPRELRRAIGTGRMLHLSATNSLLVDGHDFTGDARVERLLADPSLHCALLYPGRQALDLSTCSREEATRFVPESKRLALFIVDGTWDLARGMINRSANLKAMTQVRFTPTLRSAYEIREQPEAHCLSTLETAHWIIERFAELGLSSRPEGNVHDGLLESFGFMVRQQIRYAESNSLRRTEGMRLRALSTRPTGN